MTNKNRRDFLKAAGIFTASSLILSPMACESKKPTSESTADTTAVAEESTKIKKDIGLQLYTLRNEISQSLDSTIEKVAQLGFKWVEGYGYENRKILGKTPQEFKKLLDDNGLKMPSTHSVTEISSSGGKAAIMDAMKFAAEDAKTAGAEYLIYAYLQEGERKSMDDYKRHADTFNQFGKICKETGIQFGYHNHDFEFQKFGDQLPYDYLMKNTDRDLVVFELDLYWITKAGFDPIEYFKKDEGRFHLWHVKDMEPGEEKFFAEVGKGTIDFKRIFEARKTSGMKYFFVEQDQSRGNPLESIETSIKYLDQAEFV